MQVKRTDISDSEVVLLIAAQTEELLPIKEHVLKEHFAKDLKVPGFRAGKSPLGMVEKQLDQSRFQNQFLEEAINDFYQKSITDENLRTIDQPSISVKKFVPFTLLEFEAKVAVLPKVKIADYKNIKLPKPKPKAVSEEDIEKVLDNIATQISEKTDVNRASRSGDQVFIDFSGVDDKGKPVNGADGKNYPLNLGTNTFIPGFEDNIIGLKAGDEKTFTLKFPKDYSLKALASRKVTFSVSLIKVQELKKPPINDEFATKVGPFKTLNELKDDVKNQLVHEKQSENDKEYESELLKEIAKKSHVKIPDVLINDEVERRLRTLNQNLAYRGQTFNEFLELEGKTEKEFTDDVLKPESEERLKGSIILSEISELENIGLTNQEVDARIQAMKTQYRDPASLAELDKSETRRDIASRMMAEKTISKLTEYSSK